jgi:uncharacterized YccA/Bax inhibitor family protein
MLSEQVLHGPGFAVPAEDADVVTLQAVVNRTGLLAIIALVGGGIGYTLAESNPAAMWISWITAAVVGIGIALFLGMKPTMARWLAPVYAIVEGVFLGAFTMLADSILEAKGLSVAGGVGVQAFIVTLCALLSMLALYSARLIRPTRTFSAVVGTLGGAIALTYLVSFVLSIFWRPLPLVSFASAANDTGAMGFLGLGVNLLILGVASMFLVFDFKRIEDLVQQRAPKTLAWYGAFGLIVTLAWIYFEAVKLVMRVAVLFGGRE